MESQTAPSRTAQLREMLPLLAISAICLVLSSLDQCTRGPSVTAMLLTHVHSLI